MKHLQCLIGDIYQFPLWLNQFQDFRAVFAYIQRMKAHENKFQTYIILDKLVLTQRFSNIPYVSRIQPFQEVYSCHQLHLLTYTNLLIGSFSSLVIRNLAISNCKKERAKLEVNWCIIQFQIREYPKSSSVSFVLVFKTIIFCIHKLCKFL